MNPNWYRLTRSVLVCMLLATAWAAAPRAVRAASGADLVVDSASDADNGSDGVCTLREAMTAALNNADYHECTGSGYGDDKISFAISGTPTITLSSSLPTLSSGVLSIEGFNSGQPVTIDGANSFQIVYVQSGAKLELRDLTLQNGSSGGGGAIYNNGELTIFNSLFTGNTSTADGGAIISGGTLYVGNSTFTNNSANYGGGITNYGVATIVNSTFSGNHAAFDGGAFSAWNPPSTTTMYNTILANSTGAEDCWNGWGNPMTGTKNIIETTTSDTTSCSSIATSTSDPLLDPITGNPGYFPLQADSPAIDMGRPKTCSQAPISNQSQNGVKRPQDGNGDTKAVCDIGSFEAPGYTFRSVGGKDGWVLESSELSNMGGSLNSGGGTLRLGDDPDNRQYRSVLSFDTAAIPDGATINDVRLKVRQQGIVGVPNPLTAFQGFKVDVKKGFFGSSAGLQNADFQAAATHTYGPFTPALVSGWYSIHLTPATVDINKLATNGGVTQIRLRFKLDDNGNALADYLSLYSGNTSLAKNRPILFVDWSVP